MPKSKAILYFLLPALSITYILISIIYLTQRAKIISANLDHSKHTNSKINNTKQCPQRIVSLLVGLDQITYQIAKNKLVGVSYLSADPTISLIANKLANIKLLKAKIEEILKLKPNVLLISRFSNTNFINTLVQNGIDVKLFDKFNSLKDTEDNIKKIANISCEVSNGEKLLKWTRSIKKRLNRKCRKIRQKPYALYVSSNLYSAGANTLISDIIELACFKNILKQQGIRNFHQLKLEDILNYNPDFLIFDDRVDIDAFFQHYVILQRLTAFKEKKIVQIESKYLMSTSHYDFLASWILYKKVYSH